MATRRTPALVDRSSERSRVLVVAFCAVPGSSAEAARAWNLLIGLGGDHVEIDALTLKGKDLGHIQRIGITRMLRVPVPELPVDAIAARAVFKERLTTFTRAVHRQLDNDRYDVVLCLDLIAAGAVMARIESRPFRLLLDVAFVPSAEMNARYPVDPDDDALEKSWRDAEKAALKAARRIVVPSRQVARKLSERIDARLLTVLHRVVDTRVFAPPAVELALLDAPTVALTAGREGTRAARHTLDVIDRLLREVPALRLVIAGVAGPGDDVLRQGIASRGLDEQVQLRDADNGPAVALILAAADVVVVPNIDATCHALPHRALEALGCRRAVVVATEPSAIKDTVSSGTHLLAVAPGDAAALASASLELVRDPARRTSLAHAGAQWIAENADAKSRLAAWVAVFADVGVRVDVRLASLAELYGPAPGTPGPVDDVVRVPSGTQPRAGAVLAPPRGDDGAAPAPVALPPLELPADPPLVDVTAQDAVPPPRPPPARMPMPRIATGVFASLPPTHGDDVMPPPSVALAPFVTTEGSVREARPPASSSSSRDVWAGDTFLDAMPPPPASPSSGRVTAAMLMTRSGTPVRPVDEAAVASRRPAALLDELGHAAQDDVEELEEIDDAEDVEDVEAVGFMPGADDAVDGGHASAARDAPDAGDAAGGHEGREAGDTAHAIAALDPPAADPPTLGPEQGRSQPTLSSARPSTTTEASAGASRPAPRSVSLEAAGEGAADDEWGRDTIADASPLAEAHDVSVKTAPPRAALGGHHLVDLTAEDAGVGATREKPE